MTATPPPKTVLDGLPSDAAFAEAKVLIIDDDPTYRFLLRGLCSKLGIQNIAEAEDGAGGLDLAARITPDLVLLDIVMPGLDGLEVCRRLRANKDNATLPILVQTGLKSDTNRIECFAAGASDVVTKPLNIAEFTARVRAHLANALYAKSLAEFHHRIEMHLDIARGFINAILPAMEEAQDMARRNGFDISVVRSDHEEIGGDLWYLSEVAPGRLLIYLIDASAHGLAGAINALRIDSLLQELRRGLASPDALLRALDEVMARSSCGRLFAAVTVALLDAGSNTLSYAASGNPHPVICQNKKARILPSGGLPLGSGYAVSELTTIDIASGDTLVLHTDGWPTDKNIDALDIIHQNLSRSDILSAETLLGDARLFDDLTLMTVRRL